MWCEDYQKTTEIYKNVILLHARQANGKGDKPDNYYGSTVLPVGFIRQDETGVLYAKEFYKGINQQGLPFYLKGITRTDANACREFNDGKWVYFPGQKIQAIIQENKTDKYSIFNSEINRMSTTIKKRGKRDNQDWQTLIPLFINCLWRTHCAVRKCLVTEKPKQLTPQEKTKIENEKLKKALEEEEAKRIAAEKAKKEADDQAEADRKAKEEAEAKRIAAEKAKKEADDQAEADRKAKEKADAQVEETKELLEEKMEELEETKEELEDTTEELNKKDDEIVELANNLENAEAENDYQKDEEIDNNTTTESNTNNVIDLVTSHVYIITDDDPALKRWKCGWSGKPKEQLKKQYGPRHHPMGATIHAWMEVVTTKKYRKLGEKLLHNRYARYRIGISEWFSLPEGKTLEEVVDESKKYMLMMKKLILPL